jgi:hypothetical protein
VHTDRSVRDDVFGFCYPEFMNRVTQWWLAL